MIESFADTDLLGDGRIPFAFEYLQSQGMHWCHKCWVSTTDTECFMCGGALNDNAPKGWYQTASTRWMSSDTRPDDINADFGPH